MRIRRSARRRGKPLASGAFGGIFGDEKIGDDPIREQASRLGHAEVVAGALEQAALDEARGDGLGGTGLLIVVGCVLPWWRLGNQTFGVSLSGFSNSSVASAIRKFKTSDGAFIWQTGKFCSLPGRRLALASGRTIPEWTFIDPAISVANQTTTLGTRAQLKALGTEALLKARLPEWVAALKARGIPVSNTPNVMSEECADLAIGSRYVTGGSVEGTNGLTDSEAATASYRAW